MIDLFHPHKPPEIKPEDVSVAHVLMHSRTDEQKDRFRLIKRRADRLRLRKLGVLSATR